VLLAVCNAKYEFTLVDIGQAGRNSDSGIYNSSSLGKAIDQNLLEESIFDNFMQTALFYLLREYC